jgi:predicted small lipoprotein YifL
MISSRFALVASLAVLSLAACGGSQPMTSAPSAEVQPAARSQQQSLKGYYLANFTTVVGGGLPGSSLCIRFKSSGSWSSSGSENFNGTYLTSGKGLYASGGWLPSPAVFMSLQGSVNAKQGSGHFIISGVNGYASGGGTFTMTRAQKGCT